MVVVLVLLPLTRHIVVLERECVCVCVCPRVSACERRERERVRERMSSEKALVPYLQRAQELQKHDPLVAYYCRLYALETGLKLNDRSASCTALLSSVMAQLEKDKPAVGLNENQEDDALHVEGFAQTIFNKADKVDRAGSATIQTARSFYASAIFFEVLNVFGQVSPEIEHMQKYAAWKAADIQKAMRDGRKPTAGPPKTASDLADAGALHDDDMSGAGDAQTHTHEERPGEWKKSGNGNGGGIIEKNAMLGSRCATNAVFMPGQRVLYSENGTAAMEPATVVRPESIGESRTFLIGLAAEAKTVSADALAPFFEPGETVRYFRAGQFHTASSVKMDVSHWPPSYTIQYNGTEVNTEGFNLALSVPETKEETPAATPTPPPIVSAPPPSAPPPSAPPPSAPPPSAPPPSAPSPSAPPPSAPPPSAPIYSSPAPELVPRQQPPPLAAYPVPSKRPVVPASMPAFVPSNVRESAMASRSPAT